MSFIYLKSTILVCFSFAFYSYLKDPISFPCFLPDIPDQCSPSPCNAVGTVRCEDKKGDFLCHCFTGWTGASCDEGKVIITWMDVLCQSLTGNGFILHIFFYSVTQKCLQRIPLSDLAPESLSRF